MTSHLRTVALAAIVAIASLSQTMHAQTGSVYARVNVPFSFDYGTSHFGQGTYLITMDDENILQVRNRTTNQSAMLLARMEFDSTPAKTGMVTFRKYGDRYFLEQVSIGGSATRVNVYQSKAEKRAAHELASRGADGTQVALALVPERLPGN